MFPKKATAAALALTMFGAAAPTLAESNSKSQPFDPWAREEQWLSTVRKFLRQGKPVPSPEFDKFFDDRFFARKFDPFEEINEAQSKFDRYLTQTEKPLLDRSLKDWFDQRMDVTELVPAVSSSGNKIVVSFTVPGLQNDSLKVDVNRSRIRVDYKGTRREEKKDASGSVVEKSQVTSSFEKIMPIPAGADADTAKTERQGDVVKIVFKKA